MNKYYLAQFNSQFIFFGFSPDVVIVIIFLFLVGLINQKKKINYNFIFSIDMI